MLKKLKSLFIIEEGDSVEKKINDKVDQRNGTSKVKQPAPSTPSEDLTELPSMPAGSGHVSQKFLTVLLKAMDESNLEGFDYLEYKQSLKSLENMEMDEDTRYKSAFAMAKTMGVTSQHLKETAGHYIQVLKKEENKFKQALVNQRRKQIHDKEDRLKQLKEGIGKKEAEIQKIQADIEKTRGQLVTLQEQIDAAGEKLGATQSDFLHTYQKLVDQIQADIDKMNQYLN